MPLIFLCETVAVRLAQRLRALDERVFGVKAPKSFAIPCRYGSFAAWRRAYTFVAIVTTADALGSRDVLQLVLAVASVIVAVAAWAGPQTKVTAEGITRSLRPISRRQVAWSEVAAVLPAKRLGLWPVTLQLTDGSTLGLPGVPLDHMPALRHCLAAQASPR
jgi:hypothetical protein